jgi:hypothetical protein
MASTDPVDFQQEISLWQISYALAYFVLPQYAYNRLHKVEELFHNNPNTAGPFFYAMACQLRKVPPNRSDAEHFYWQVGELDETTDFYVMVHPTPPPVDFSGFESDAKPVLAPYFSGIFRNRRTGKISYFVLGQSPGGEHGEGTTLRSVTLDPMVNANLGPGPDPDLDSFLASVAFRLDS